MAGSALVDAGFLVALLSRRDGHHGWARCKPCGLRCRGVPAHPPCPKHSICWGRAACQGCRLCFSAKAVVPAFDLRAELGRVIKLMQKYVDVPMSLADACLVRMTETFADPVLLTTDRDFLIYRRHGRHVVPVRIPS